jgi:hypothetical protein
MDGPKTYHDLTSKQRWALQALTAELNSLPIAETIFECVRLRGIDISTTAGKTEVRRALGGARATGLIFSHVFALRDVNEQRRAINRAIHERLQFPYPTRREEVPAYVEAGLDAVMWSGRLEIALQQFADLCIQLWMLIRKAAAAAGYDVPQDDLDYLNSFRPLRTYSAHIDNRLPGGINQDEVISEIETERGWRIIGGFEIDELDRVVINGQAIEVNDRGFERADKIARSTLAGLKPSAIAQLHQYFVQHPETIPPVSAVRQDGLTRVAKSSERASRTSGLGETDFAERRPLAHREEKGVGQR